MANTTKRGTEEVNHNEIHNATRLIWERLGRSVYCLQLEISGRRFLVMNRQILEVKRQKPLLFSLTIEQMFDAT